MSRKRGEVGRVVMELHDHPPLYSKKKEQRTGGSQLPPPASAFPLITELIEFFPSLSLSFSSFSPSSFPPHSGRSFQIRSSHTSVPFGGKKFPSTNCSSLEFFQPIFNIFQHNFCLNRTFFQRIYVFPLMFIFFRKKNNPVILIFSEHLIFSEVIFSEQNSFEFLKIAPIFLLNYP